MSQHIYLSTSCFHEEHEYCQGKLGMAGPKEPAKCKFCEAMCLCECHYEEVTDGQHSYL